jgi:uncharacterized MnhB-related membrane protein
MPTNFPAVTGQVVTADFANQLVAFTVTTETGNYTLDNDDLYQVFIQLSAAGTKTVTIAPDSALTAAVVGSAVTFCNTGAGLLTFAAGSGVTITSAGAVSAAPTLATHKVAQCVRISANTWRIYGGIA